MAAGITPPATIPGTPQFSQPLDTFAQPIGSLGHANLSRLASVYGFEWYVDEADTLQLAEPQASDPVSFTYDGAAAQLHSADFQTQRRHNHVARHGPSPARDRRARSPRPPTTPTCKTRAPFTTTTSPTAC